MGIIDLGGKIMATEFRNRSFSETKAFEEALEDFKKEEKVSQRWFIMPQIKIKKTKRKNVNERK